MNCPIANRHPEMVVEYAAGALDPETACALERHLTGCAACRSMAAAQTAVWNALDDFEAPAVSPDFDPLLYRRIDQRVRLLWWERLTRPFRPMRLRQAVPVTATAGLVLLASLLVQHPGRIAPVVPGGQAVRAEQVESALDDLDLLRQLGTANSADDVHPDAL